MSSFSWLQTIETQLNALGCRLLTDERPDLVADVEQTAGQLQQRRVALNACRETLRDACGRLLASERRVVELERAVRACTADRDRAAALEQAVRLEQTRESLAAERVRVGQLRIECDAHLTELGRLEQRLASLQARLSAC